MDAPQPLLETSWIKPAARIIPYGTNCTVEGDFTDLIGEMDVDPWEPCLIGPFGCLRRYVDSDKVTREYLHAELGSLCAGETLRHKSAQPTILYRQRGVSISDIALRYAMLEKANLPGIGRALPSA